MECQSLKQCCLSENQIDVENQGNGTGEKSQSIFTPTSSQAEVAPSVSAEAPSSCNHLCGEGVEDKKEWHIRPLAKRKYQLLKLKAFDRGALEISAQIGTSVANVTTWLHSEFYFYLLSKTL